MRNSPRNSILKGAVFTFAMSWTDRLIGLVSTIVLARLLVPEDFGLIAMASLAIGLVDVFLNLGVHVALIQNQQATQEHFNTAWTLRLIQTTLATLALIVCSPYAAAYFHDQRVGPVLQALAFMLLLAGLENIGLVAFQKNMQFGSEAKFLFLRRISGFFITILGAWLLRSYWALVIGTLASRAIGVTLSYRMHPMRPRFSLSRVKEIFAVSQWMLVRSIGGYLQDNLHNALVGRWSSTTTMGAYSLAGEISSMPSSELLAPLNRVLFPAFAGVKQDPVGLKRLFLLAQSVQSLVAIPAAVGLALLAEEVVLLFLGEKWHIVAPFIQVLALVHVVSAMTTSGNYVLIVLGKLRMIALITWTQIGLFALVALTALSGSEALHLAWLRLGIVWAGLWFSFWLLLRALPVVRWRDLGQSCWRPLVGAGAMAAVLLGLAPFLDLPLLLRSVVKVAIGASVYVSVVLSLWGLVGRPDGAERYVLDKLFAGLSRLSLRLQTTLK